MIHSFSEDPRFDAAPLPAGVITELIFNRGRLGRCLRCKGAVGERELVE